jgi:hypothetical protein
MLRYDLATFVDTPTSTEISHQSNRLFNVFFSREHTFELSLSLCLPLNFSCKLFLSCVNSLLSSRLNLSLSLSVSLELFASLSLSYIYICLSLPLSHCSPLLRVRRPLEV